MNQVAQYEHTEREVTESSLTTLRYIMEGEGIDAPYDIRGLVIFGIIQILRENDEMLYSDEEPLLEGQLTRLREVESAVDDAVERNMQYYPFGHDTNRVKIDNQDYRRLKNTGHTNLSLKPSKSKTRNLRRRYLQDVQAQDYQPSGEVVVRTIDIKS